MSIIYTIEPGVPLKLLDALTATADTKGTSYAVPIRAPGYGALGRVITWQTLPTNGPSAISLQLQGAMNDTDAEYSVIDSSTLTTGETKVVTVTNYRFIRARQVSRSGGTDVTVQIVLG